MQCPVHTVRYKIGDEVFTEIKTDGIVWPIHREAVVGGLYCDCRGTVFADEPGVMVMDCVPFQTAGGSDAP